jgi:hypothetical protein
VLYVGDSFWNLNHAVEPRVVIVEAARVLRPRGLLLLVLDDMPPRWRRLGAAGLLRNRPLRIARLIGHKLSTTLPPLATAPGSRAADRTRPRFLDGQRVRDDGTPLGERVPDGGAPAPRRAVTATAGRPPLTSLANRAAEGSTSRPPDPRSS